MILVDQDDVLRGLKRCKRLAKQAILASGRTADPSFWTTQAEARRTTYDDLMARIQREGIEPTYQAARSRYEQLTASLTPHETGERQALEMFFTILGLNVTPPAAPEQGAPQLVTS
ncbi:MAG TPA: hypothetical protein GXX28_10080 [Firmicutes bacterium]|nr:hypothetical protein [Bacillota bacterium]